jgi:hypothetical protein
MQSAHAAGGGSLHRRGHGRADRCSAQLCQRGDVVVYEITASAHFPLSRQSESRAARHSVTSGILSRLPTLRCCPRRPDVIPAKTELPRRVISRWGVANQKTEWTPRETPQTRDRPTPCATATSGHTLIKNAFNHKVTTGSASAAPES